MSGFYTRKSGVLFLFSLFLFSCTLPTGDEGNRAPDLSSYPRIYRDYLEYKSTGVIQTGKFSLYDWSSAGYSKGSALPSPSGPVFYPSDFGAFIDDGIDDTAAIQAALDAAFNRGGGVVQLQSGRYDMNNSNPWQVIRIPGSNITLRGMGTGEEGTVIKMWNPPSIIDGFDTDYMIEAGGAPITNLGSEKVLDRAEKGSRRVKINSTSGFSAGETVIIRMYNRNDSVTGERTDELSRELVAPLQPESTWTNFKPWAPFVFTAQIERILDEQVIELVQPLPRDIKIMYSPDVRPFTPNSSSIGVENLILEGNFVRSYRHHGDSESDYGWGGIKFTGLRDSWVRNVKTRNIVSDIIVQQSFNVTVKDFSNEGNGGHTGVGIYGSWMCLVEGAAFGAHRTHSFSVNNQASGNVFTESTNTSPTDWSATIDFHGGFTSYNLFEQLEGFRVASAGAIQNMPHSGQHNTFWNVDTATGRYATSDFFSYGLYSYSDYIGEFWSEWKYSNHQLHPRSILVGVYSLENPLTVDMRSSDFTTGDEYYLEKFNTGPVEPLSLYKAQKKVQ